jgi:hypothetical protein
MISTSQSFRSAVRGELPTEISCEYQSATDSVLVYQHGYEGIHVVDVPLEALLDAIPSERLV